MREKQQNSIFCEFVFHVIRNKTFMALSEVEIVNDSFNSLRFDVLSLFSKHTLRWKNRKIWQIQHLKRRSQHSLTG